MGFILIVHIYIKYHGPPVFTLFIRHLYFSLPDKIRQKIFNIFHCFKWFSAFFFFFFFKNSSTCYAVTPISLSFTRMYSDLHSSSLQSIPQPFQALSPDPYSHYRQYLIHSSKSFKTLYIHYISD